MYKYVSRYTEDLRNFTYEDVDMRRLAMTGEERLQEDREGKYETHDEDIEDVYHCTICGKDLKKNLNAVSFHAGTRQHKKKVKEYKARYRKYIRLVRRTVLKASAPRNEHYRRLIYYKRLINFS